MYKCFHKKLEGNDLVRSAYVEKTHNDDNNDKTLCTVLRLIQAVFL